jgi:hypothetical protein
MHRAWGEPNGQRSPPCEGRRATRTPRPRHRPLRPLRSSLHLTWASEIIENRPAVPPYLSIDRIQLARITSLTP